MVAGSWMDNDGLYRQYGQAKPGPEIGGDYMIDGDYREFEQLIPLVPMTIGGLTVSAPPTSFSGTGTAAAAGIQSVTSMFPLQTTAVNTGGTTITLTATQLYIQEVEVITLIGATGGTSIAIGLVTDTNAATPNVFQQVTPNAGTQIVKNMLTANFATTGQKATFTQPGSTGLLWSAPNGSPIAGGGDWIGNVPLVTNSITPLPTKAWLSTIATGAYTNGLIKVRIKYTLYGNISY